MLFFVFFTLSLTLCNGQFWVWGTEGPIEGYYCIQIYSASNPHSWSDNYLCTLSDIGLYYTSSYTGPISGKVCIHMEEPYEPSKHSWSNNYICLRDNSLYELHWSYSGAIAGKSCIQIIENNDPKTWNDNYLCYDCILGSSVDSSGKCVTHSPSEYHTSIPGVLTQNIKNSNNRKLLSSPIYTCSQLKETNPSVTSGVYTFSDLDNININCKYNSDYSWTLIESFSLANTSPFHNSYWNKSYSINEYSFSILDYRLSKSHMLTIRDNSDFMLATCNLNTNMTLDYLFMPIYNQFWDNSGAGVLYNIYSGNVRGIDCVNKQVKFWYEFINFHGLSTDSSLDENCGWSSGAEISEDNFGTYGSINTLFSCTSSPSSTTQWWLGTIIPTPNPTNTPDQICHEGAYVIYCIRTSSGIIWEDSENYCMNTYGRHLASITNDNERNEVINLLNTHGNYQSWIGGKSSNGTNGWYWSDSNDFNYTIWADGEPNFHGNPNCLNFWNNHIGYWGDNVCTEAYTGYFCNKNVPTPAPSPQPTNNPTPAQTCYHGLYVIYCIRTITTINYYDSETYCLNTFGRHLASITNENKRNESVYMLNTYGNHQSWIGAQSTNGINGWYWEDGSNFNYTIWADGEPNFHANPNCLNFWNNYIGYWGDNSCNEAFNAYFCNKNVPTPPPTQPPTKTPTLDPTKGPTDNPTTAQTCYEGSYVIYCIRTITAINYYESETYCLNTFGRHLASITNSNKRNESIYMLNTYGNHASWIGAQSTNGINGWFWEDGSNWVNTWWTGDEPNNNINPNCLIFWDSYIGFWGDNTCTERFNAYFCNKNVPTPAPTMSPTKTPTINPTNIPTIVPTRNPTLYPSNNPTRVTLDPSIPPTKYPSNIPSISPTLLPTISPSKSPSKFPSKNPTDFPSFSPSKNPTNTPSDSPTNSPTNLPTANPTSVPTNSPTDSPTLPTNSPSNSPTNIPTDSPSSTPSNSPTSNTEIPSQVPSHNPTNAPSNAPTNTPTLSPTNTPTNNPTNSPSNTPSNSPTDSPTNNPSNSPTDNPSNSPTNVPSNTPTNSPTDTPSVSPTDNPTDLPTNSPSNTPTVSPTNAPTNMPSNSPTNFPSDNPTNSPSETPTNSPTNMPTDTPSNSPTSTPSNSPTIIPTNSPTNNPTDTPSNSPTDTPTQSPTNLPTNTPTNTPTNNPTVSPTNSPTNSPSNSPTDTPSNSPSNSPTIIPTDSPTNSPVNSPTNSPTNTPSNSPTNTPSTSPTNSPTTSPSNSPTNSPSYSPTNSPTNNPSNSPTNSPSNSPTNSPTNTPTYSPTLAPTRFPTPSNKYDGYLTTSLILPRITDNTVDSLANLVFNNTLYKLEQIIEREYIAEEYLILTYRKFAVRIVSIILQDEIGSTELFDIWDSNHTDISPDFNDTKDRRLQNDISVYEFVTNNITYQLWTDERFIPDFESVNSNRGFGVKLFSNVFFFLDPEDDDAPVRVLASEVKTIEWVLTNTLDALEEDDWFADNVVANDLLFLNVLVILLSLLVSIIAFIHMKCVSEKLDSIKIKWFVIYILQIWDFLSDLLFVTAVYNKWKHNKVRLENNLLLFMSSLFIIIPWCSNMYYIIAKHKEIEMKFENNQLSKMWFKKHFQKLALFTVLSGSLYPAILLVNTKYFGVELFNMGLGNVEIISFLSLKVKLSILLENVPQLLLNIIFIIFNPDNVDVNVIMPMVTSVISIISASIQYKWAKGIIRDGSVRYNITIEHDSLNSNILLADEDSQQCDLDKLKSKIYCQQTLFTHLLVDCQHSVKVDNSEVVSILVDKNITIIILDCFHVNTMSFIREIKKDKKNIFNAIKYTFDLTNDYEIHISEPIKQWTKQKNTFCKKLIEREIESRNKTQMEMDVEYNEKTYKLSLSLFENRMTTSGKLVQKMTNYINTSNKTKDSEIEQKNFESEIELQDLNMEDISSKAPGIIITNSNLPYNEGKLIEEIEGNEAITSPSNKNNNVSVNLEGLVDEIEIDERFSE